MKNSKVLTPAVVLFVVLVVAYLATGNQTKSDSKQATASPVPSPVVATSTPTPAVSDIAADAQAPTEASKPPSQTEQIVSASIAAYNPAGTNGYRYYHIDKVAGQYAAVTARASADENDASITPVKLVLVNGDNGWTVIARGDQVNQGYLTGQGVPGDIAGQLLAG